MLSLSKYEGLWSVSPFMRSLVLFSFSFLEANSRPFIVFIDENNASTFKCPLN